MALTLEILLHLAGGVGGRAGELLTGTSVSGGNPAKKLRPSYARSRLLPDGIDATS